MNTASSSEKNKIDCVLQYARNQILVPLGSYSFTIVKTEQQFRGSYKRHDVACQHIVKFYLRQGYQIQHIGADFRDKKVAVKNDVPNYLAVKGEDAFCFDAKSKSNVSYFGVVNERSAISYKQLAKGCNIKVFLNFVQVVGSEVRNNFGFCDIESTPVSKGEQMWDGNIIWRYEWRKGLAGVPWNPNQTIL